MVNLLNWLLLLLLQVWVRGVDSLAHRSTIHGLLHLLHLHLLLWLVRIVIVLGLGHGSGLHRLILLLLLILVEVDGFCGRHLLLVVNLRRDTVMLIVTLILEVAHAGVLQVLGFNEEDVSDEKSGEDGAQNGQVHGVIIDPITVADES